MARIAGNTGTLNLPGGVRLGATNITWTSTRDTPDATGMDSGGARQYVDGNISATFSLTAHADTNALGLPATVQTGGAVAFTLQIDAVPSRSYTGTCRITSCTATVDVDGTVTYGIEATVEGAWVEGP